MKTKLRHIIPITITDVFANHRTHKQSNHYANWRNDDAMEKRTERLSTRRKAAATALVPAIVLSDLKATFDVCGRTIFIKSSLVNITIVHDLLVNDAFHYELNTTQYHFDWYHISSSNIIDLSDPSQLVTLHDLRYNITVFRFP